MSKIIKDAILFLEKNEDFVSLKDLEYYLKQHHKFFNFYSVIKSLKETIYIGYDKEKGLKWFNWEAQNNKTKELLLKNQAAINRAANW
jgi:hypothetical protein